MAFFRYTFNDRDQDLIEAIIMSLGLPASMPVWACLGLFGPAWACLDLLGPVSEEIK